MIFSNSFSEEIYKQTYEFNNEGIEGTWKRIAKNLASVEEDKEKWEKEFEEALRDFKFIPGGRIYSNAGTDIKGTTQIVEMSSHRMLVADTDIGVELNKQIRDLEKLLYAYRHGLIKENIRNK